MSGGRRVKSFCLFVSDDGCGVLRFVIIRILYVFVFRWNMEISSFGVNRSIVCFIFRSFFFFTLYEGDSVVLKK